MADDSNTPVITSRKEAKERGLTHYFSGRPCPQGHLAMRRVNSMHCMECVRNMNNAWKKRTIEKRRAQERERYARNPEKFRNKTLRYYQANCEEMKRKQRERHKRTYDEEKRKRAVERARQWAERHPDRAKQHRRNGKARRKNVIGSHTAEDIKEIFAAQRGRCACCRKKLRDKYHVDHIIAVINGGTNYRQNIQILCARCNLLKADRDPIDHMRSLGRLL